MFRGTYDAPGDDGAVGGCAQLTGAPPPQAIGKIQTATGPVTVVDASGVAAQVKVGDSVYRHDTIETGTDGAVGITFTDGTAFNLSNNARMALNEFVCDGTSNSALFSLSKGVFAFIAGKVAKAGGLRIDTPFARIRGAAQDGGIGILTLAALAFSTLREIQAASRSDAFLDDSTITYKDSPHGTFEITTRDGRVIAADDPGETVVVDPAGSVTRIPNSSSRMAELQQAQQNALSTLSLGLGQQGPAPGGSSTDTFNIPLQLQPINFSQPQNNNDPGPTHPTVNPTPPTQGFIESNPPPPPLPTIAISTFAGHTAIDAGNIINANQANAGINVTGTTTGVKDGGVVTITIVDGFNQVVFTSTTTVTNGTWLINLSSTDAKALADGNYIVTADVSNPAGNHALASQLITVDQDVNEHPSVVVNVGSTTPIGAGGAGQVAFTISGLEADDNGTLTFSDQAGHVVVVTIVNGQAVDSQGHPISTVNLSSLSDGTITSSLAIIDTAGNQFSASGNGVPLEQKLGEHPSVLVNGGSTTPIGTAGAGQVAFTISGLASDDSGTLTFSDQAGHAVGVTIANGQAVDSQGHPISTVNLSSLSDGTITSSLAVSDPAGNQFSASGTAVLDQDLGEHPSVLVNVGSTTPIGAARAGQVAFTISGLEADDNGTLTFSDQAGHTVGVTIANGQAVDSQGHPISTVNLSSLSDGTITSSLAIIDTAGNQFSASGNAVPLEQKLGEHPSVLVNGGSTTPIGAAGAGQVAFTISGLASDDRGTLTFSDQAGHTVGVTIANGQAVDSQGHPISTVNLSSLSDGTITSLLAVSDPAGNQFSASGTAVPLDQDLGEHLSVLVNGGSTTPIGAADAGQVAFTISGLEADDNGTLTFSDQAGHTVGVTIVNGQAVDSQGHPISTVNLSSLSEGTITSSLAIIDTAGNQFSASGNAVPFDTDLGEHPSVLVNGGSTTPIGAAGAGQVAFTISGLHPDDSGTLTFSDQAGHTVGVTIANGQAVDSQGHPLSTVNLSSLSDGTITSSLAVSDPAGNQFSAGGNAVPLDQDLGEHPTVSFNGLTGGHAVEDQIITAVVSDTDNDVPTSGITYTWQISHDGGNTWSTVGGNARTYTPSEADEGGLLKVLASFTDAAGNTEGGSSIVGVLPLLTIANNLLSVSPNGSVSLGITLTQEPTPDDTISVTISFPGSGAHDPTIAAGDDATGNPHTSGGITTYTFSTADVNSGLTFTNHGDQSDTLTVNEILNGDIVSTAQTITVTDPPVFGGGTIVSNPPVSAPSENTSVQSTSAHDLIVSSLFTETLSGNGDRSAFLFKATLDHHITDPEINFAQSNAENLLHLPAQLDDNGVRAMTDGAHPADLPVDVNQLPSFKFADDGSAHPGHATGNDTSVQSTPADNGHHAIADPEIYLASIAPNQLPQHPADNSLHIDNSLHMPAQLDDNGVRAMTDEAHPVDLPVDVNQLASFKFADDGAHPGTIVPHDSPTLTALLNDSIGTHGPAAPDLAKTFDVPGTVMSDAALDKFIFAGNLGHDMVAGHNPDMTEIDHTVPADIQHVLDTAHDTNAVSTLDPNHATAPQDITKVQLPHHQGDFHFA